MVLVNNGHTIQGTYTNGYYNNDDANTWYQIGQFHFHTHSEESVKGVGDVASLHLVHTQNPPPSPTDMAISVVGVLFVIGPIDNPVIAPIIDALVNLPVSGNSTIINFPGFQSTFAAARLANTDDYWNYPGSLTTPPCTEQIDWTLLATPWTISQNQWNQLNAVLAADTNSSVPTQTSNYRQIQRTLTNVNYYKPGSTAPVSPVPVPPCHTGSATGLTTSVLLAGFLLLQFLI